MAKTMTAIQIHLVRLAYSLILLKIYERAIANRTIAINTENSWLSPLQFDFQKVLMKKMIVLLPQWRKTYRKKSSLFVYFFYIKSTYDAT